MVWRLGSTHKGQGSRSTAAEPLTQNDSTEVANALSGIYRKTQLTYPKLLQIDPGREFMGSIQTIAGKTWCDGMSREQTQRSRYGRKI